MSRCPRGIRMKIKLTVLLSTAPVFLLLILATLLSYFYGIYSILCLYRLKLLRGVSTYVDSVRGLCIRVFQRRTKSHLRSNPSRELSIKLLCSHQQVQRITIGTFICLRMEEIRSWADHVSRGRIDYVQIHYRKVGQNF